MIVKLQTSQRFDSSSNQHPTPASKSAWDILKTKAPLISVYLQWNEEICPSYTFILNEWVLNIEYLNIFLSSCEGLKSGYDWLESICQLHIETLSIILAANGPVCPVSSVGGVLRGKKVLNVECWDPALFAHMLLTSGVLVTEDGGTMCSAHTRLCK